MTKVRGTIGDSMTNVRGPPRMTNVGGTVGVSVGDACASLEPGLRLMGDVRGAGQPCADRQG